MLKDVLKNKPNVDVVKLQKSGGVVSRNPKVRQRARGGRIRVIALTKLDSECIFFRWYVKSLVPIGGATLVYQTQ